MSILTGTLVDRVREQKIHSFDTGSLLISKGVPEGRVPDGHRDGHRDPFGVGPGDTLRLMS